MIVPSTSQKQSELNAPPLPLYAQYIDYPDECGFWGVRVPDDGRRGHCDVWTLDERNAVLRALKKSNEDIAGEAKYPFWPMWTSEDNLRFGRGVSLKYGRLLDIGTRAEEVIQTTAVVDYSTEPATVGPFAAPTVTSPNEVCVFHPGSNIPIAASDIQLQSGQVYIEIPRCRLVELSKANNPKNGWLFSELGNFEETVDVKRIYTDTTQQGYVYCEGCHHDNCDPHEQHEICVTIIDAHQGIVDIETVEHHALCNCRNIRTTVNFRSGLEPITSRAMEILVRLANSQMPKTPCGCEQVQAIWMRDRSAPEFLSTERQANPFGPTDGAWYAWMGIASMKRRRLLSMG